MIIAIDFSMLNSNSVVVTCTVPQFSCILPSNITNVHFFKIKTRHFVSRELHVIKFNYTSSSRFDAEYGFALEFDSLF